MNKIVAIPAAIVVALLVAIALSVPWHRQPTPPVIVASPSPPLPTPKPAIPVKAPLPHKPKVAAPKPAYSCADLKKAEGVLTQQQIEAMGVKRGATPDQVRAAQGACK